MAINDSMLRAQILTASLGADLGAVDVPEAPVFSLLGFAIFPGQNVYDTVTGEILEVVDAGIQAVNPNAAGY